MAIRESFPWRGGQRVVVAPMNDGISEPIDDLSGDNGVIEYRGSLAVLDGTGGDRYVRLPSGTTMERPSTPLAGYLRYNTTLNIVEFYDGSAWQKLIQTITAVVTYASLNTNGDVGSGATQVAAGNHTH